MYHGKSVGVVLATYNGEKYICKQLESIQNQSVQVDRLVVVDDHSNDNTVRYTLKKLNMTAFKYTHIINKTNEGVAKSFERAVVNCDADYIFFCDQDDEWEHDKIKVMMDIMLENKVQAAFSNAEVVDEKMNHIGDLWESIGYKPDEKITIYKKGDNKFLLELIRHNVATGMCMCIDSNIKNEILPLSKWGIHDKWIILIAAARYKICSINIKLVRYRQHRDNQIGTKTDLVRMMHRRSVYRVNIVNRIKMIQEFINKCEDVLNIELKAMYEGYLEFLDMRCRFIDRKVDFFWIIENKKKYNYYIYNYKPIMAKDIVCRLFGGF